MKLIQFTLLCLLLMFSFSACSSGDDNKGASSSFVATQAMLDAATVVRVEAKTGPHLEMRSDMSGHDTIPLNGRSWNGTLTPNPNPNATVREVLCTVAGSNMPVGTVLSKHVYTKNPDGSKGSLRNLGAMIKHPAGYFPQGGDWEYILMDPASATAEHPNGQLSQATFRNTTTECGDCHTRAGGDYVFISQ